MIFVTVGNAKQPFNRLVEKVDWLVESGQLLGEPIILQSGNTDYEARYCIQHEFLSPSEFKYYLEEATIVIAHGGAGSIIEVLEAGKIPIVVPRRRSYAEHIDDHQVELAECLSIAGKVIPVWEIDELMPRIEDVRQSRRIISDLSPPKMLMLITDAINEYRVSLKGGITS